MIFEQLIDPTFTPVMQADPHALVNAQVGTLDFLTANLQDGASVPFQYPPTSPSDAALAQQAFTSLLNGDSSANKSLVNLRTPAAVRHHVTMLSAYDWEFVEEAKRIRGYVVAKLLDETTHPDARIRLKSLELVGKLTEVASFTERSEVVHKHEDHSVIEERLRSRLRSLLPAVQEVQDSEVKDIAVVRHEPRKD